MSLYKIRINDILGSNNIDINTPIIILSNVPKKYLIRIDKSAIYNVDTESIYSFLINEYQFIDNFIPIGQIYVSDNQKKSFTLIFTNTRIIPITQNYEEINKNVWVGSIRRNDKINRSLGTIASYNKPIISVPVFPVSFLKKIHEDDLLQSEYSIYSDIYSNPTYGRWVIDIYKFNINYTNDRIHLKMIDSSGEINNMFIPSLQKNRFNQKTYSDTLDTVYDDIGNISMNEYNGFLDEVYSVVDNIDSQQNEKKIILKEKDEPWFTDSNIVGIAASDPQPHKITGIISPISEPGDDDENNAPANSDCNLITKTPIVGYSRYDIDKKCRKVENFESESVNMDYINNTIMYVICFIIIILLLFRYSSSRSIL